MTTYARENRDPARRSASRSWDLPSSPPTNNLANQTRWARARAAAEQIETFFTTVCRPQAAYRRRQCRPQACDRPLDARGFPVIPNGSPPPSSKRRCTTRLTRVPPSTSQSGCYRGAGYTAQSASRVRLGGVSASPIQPPLASVLQ